MTLEPSVRRSVVLPFSHSGGGTITARLRDRRRPGRRQHRVRGPAAAAEDRRSLLVSPGNLFLEKVLRPILRCRSTCARPISTRAAWATRTSSCLDSVTPPTAGPGRFIFVNAVPPDVPIEVLGRIERPTIMDWDRTHPVMRHVELAKVTIEDALRVCAAGGAGAPLVEAVGGPLVYALEEPDRKALVRRASICSRPTSRCGWRFR